MVAFAMRHLAVMLSFGESKRDTRGVIAMATEAMATDSSLSSMPSVKEGLVMMVVLMSGVTLLVALAMRHLAVMFSLGESKRDTRGVFAMATEAMKLLLPHVR